jgi:histidine ammonia-lyase
MTDRLPTVSLGETGLGVEALVAAARGAAHVALAGGAVERLAASRRALEAVAGHDPPTYGVNTGFGHLAGVRIAAQDLDRLQLNLVRSHACGVGQPLDDEVVRAMLLLLVNSLAKGHSGVRPVLVESLLAVIRAGILPRVPSRGSVGASGDLAPLAHCALTLIGEGLVRVDGVDRPAADALRQAGLEPLALRSKEGLALLNGTHLMAALGALAVVDLRRLLHAATAAAATAVEGLLGSHTPFDARIHDLRRQPGQIAVAGRLRELLHDSGIVESHRNCARVQDPYSLRCVPQVLGAVSDALDHLAAVVGRELDAVTDNPLLFDGPEPRALSGGNFHGQPLALPLDHLAVAVAELAAFSERRTALLVSPGPAGLPAFLAAEPGLECGLMIPQYVAAAVVAELGVLAHPAGTHNVPTSAGMEDFNSMGATSGLKLRRAVELAYRVVAIELTCAAAAVDHHRPLTAGAGVEAVVERVRRVVPPVHGDRSTADDLERLAAALAGGLLDDV